MAIEMKDKFKKNYDWLWYKTYSILVNNKSAKKLYYFLYLLKLKNEICDV